MYVNESRIRRQVERADERGTDNENIVSSAYISPSSLVSGAGKGEGCCDRTDVPNAMYKERV